MLGLALPSFLLLQEGHRDLLKGEGGKGKGEREGEKEFLSIISRKRRGEEEEEGDKKIPLLSEPKTKATPSFSSKFSAG